MSTTGVSEMVPDPYLEAILQQLHAAEAVRDAAVLDVRVGPFWTVVQTTLGTGMASTSAYELRPCGRDPITAAGTLLDYSALQLAELSRSPSAPEASVGVATINALLGHPQCPITSENAEAIIRRRGKGRRVAIIGHFPFSERLQPECDQVWVLERGARLRPGDLSAEQMAEVLPAADVVAISGTTLINHTLASIMSLVRDDAFVLMLGPSTPMTPLLHERGFTALCGTWITEAEPALRTASQGAVLKQIAGGRRLVCWRGEPQ